jgi:hypothetical protein
MIDEKQLPDMQIHALSVSPVFGHTYQCELNAVFSQIVFCKIRQGTPCKDFDCTSFTLLPLYNADQLL